MPRRATAGPTASPGYGERGVRIRLLEGFRLEIDHRTVEAPASVQRLIAFLALHQTALNRGYAAGLLWLDVSDDRATANLRSTLWRLRQLADDVVVARNGTIQLHPDVSVDVHEATRLARRWIAGTVTEHDFETGAGIFECDLLPDWYDDWIVAERERFRQLRLHALEAIVEQCITRGRLGDALIAALAAIVADPLRETAHRALIRVHLAEGNTGEAVRQMRRYEQLLRDELDVVPSTRLAELLL